MRTKTVSIATAVIAVALLAGCSTGGSDSGSGSGSSPGATTAAGSSQSRSAACTAFESKVKSAAEGLQSQVTQLQSNPKAAVSKLEEFDTSLSEGVDAVTNPIVKPKAEAFQSAYTDMLTQVQAIAKDPASADLSAFSKTTTAVQDAGRAFQKTCAS